MRNTKDRIQSWCLQWSNWRAKVFLWNIWHTLQRTVWKPWKSFRHKAYSTETNLAKYCWELKDKGAVHTGNFSIAKRVKSKSLINNCSLCLSEKLFIIRNLDNINMLNKKSEFISKCHHINKQLLIKVKDDSND